MALYHKLDAYAARWFDAPLRLQADAIYRLVLGVGPVVIASLVCPQWIVSGFVILTTWCLYRAMRPFQARIFDYDREQITFWITTPFYCFFSVWGLAVFAVHRPEQLGRTVGSLVFLGLVCIWPVYRSNRKLLTVRARRIPFEHSYSVAAALVIVQQLSIVWNRVL
jgi:hypothetical protein